MKKLLALLALVVFLLVSCTPVPTYLHKHVFQDMETGRVYRVHWNKGPGNTWYWYELLRNPDGSYHWQRAEDPAKMED